MTLQKYRDDDLARLQDALGCTSCRYADPELIGVGDACRGEDSIKLDPCQLRCKKYAAEVAWAAVTAAAEMEPWADIKIDKEVKK